MGPHTTDRHRKMEQMWPTPQVSTHPALLACCENRQIAKGVVFINQVEENNRGWQVDIWTKSPAMHNSLWSLTFWLFQLHGLPLEVSAHLQGPGSDPENVLGKVAELPAQPIKTCRLSRPQVSEAQPHICLPETIFENRGSSVLFARNGFLFCQL